MTNLDSKIEQILADLCQIDPSFSQHEAKIKGIIKEVLLSKPDTKFDEQFAKALRHKLLAQADILKEKNNLSMLQSFQSVKKWNYALSTLAVVAVVAAGGLYYRSSKNSGTLPTLLGNETQVFSSELSINRQGKEAFGKLAANTAAGLGGGGGNNAAGAPDTNSKIAPYGMGGGASMPAFVKYEFVYKGENFTVDNSQMEVFRRIKAPITGVSASSILKGLNFGIVNIKSFSNLTVQNLNLAEDKDFGYIFDISMQEGRISISENWLKWPTPEKQCRDPQCYENVKLKISDVPDDQTLIGWTGQFLKDHNISTANYGAPFVESSWKNDYLAAADKTNSYIPSIITIIYPQILNGKDIYDEGGNKTGLAVSVDLYAKKVSGIGELYARNYDSSIYDVETDTNKLLEIAKHGGLLDYTVPTNEQPSRTVNVELGTPKIVYVKTYQYPQSGTSQELIVPALVFPVMNPPQDYPFYQKNIVVHLPKDMLQTSDPIRIMQ